ncbi:cytochrome b [Novosphingobium sp.]|uniref:cytochrome b n=1 Tax=Novosphingobium sp. TaxID=1874826 RepID=UPI0035B45859
MDTNSTLSPRYARGSVVLHWLIALLIMLNFAAAWVAEDLPKAEKAMVMGNHKSIGLVILALTVLRIVWRLVHKAPPLVDTLKAWEVALSKVTHVGFYFLMLAIPLAGWAMVSGFSHGAPTSVFGLFNAPALPVSFDKETVGVYHELHEVFANLMIALFVIHVAAVIKHVHIDKDGTLRRMVPFLK